jgi:hypothetical protein
MLSLSTLGTADSSKAKAHLTADRARDIFIKSSRDKKDESYSLSVPRCAVDDIPVCPLQ